MSFEASYSAGAASETMTFSSVCAAAVSATPANLTVAVPPAGTLNATGPASGPSGPANVTLAAAPVSPFDSVIEATTSTGLVVSVCGGASTAETTRSGRSRAVVEPRSTYVRVEG